MRNRQHFKISAFQHFQHFKVETTKSFLRSSFQVGRDLGMQMLYLSEIRTVAPPQDHAKTASRHTQDTFKTPQDGPRRPQNVPKTLQNDALPRRARTLPKTLQEASQTFPNLPRRPPRVLVRSCLSWFGSVGPGSVLFVLVRSWFGSIDPVCPGSVLLFLVRSCWSCFGAGCTDANMKNLRADNAVPNGCIK